MIVSVTFLSTIVTIALAISAVAPVCLLVLFARDWRTGKIW